MQEHVSCDHATGHSVQEHASCDHATGHSVQEHASCASFYIGTKCPREDKE